MKTQPKTESEIHVERLDDIPLLIALQQQIGIAEIIDDVIARHPNHLGLSLGQLVVGWNAYILSESDHRKVPVQQWAIEHQEILSNLLGTPLRRTDFTDDRLGQVLSHLSKDPAWREIETQLWHRTVTVYRLTPERVRLDATRFSGYHTPAPDGLMQHGYNPKTPHQAQVKLMAASIDCGTSGHLLATDVVSGEQADDPLYLPLIARVRQMLDESGLLYIGDSKMGAIETRAQLAAGGDFYLVPLAKVGDVPALYEQCLAPIISGSQSATLIYTADVAGNPTQLIAAGYQTHRTQQTTLPSGQTYTWDERLLVVRSLSEAKKQFATLKRNLEAAQKALLALTPDPGRGRKPIREETVLNQKAQAILGTYKVGDYLRYTYDREESVKTQYIGRGRGSATRPKREIRTVWYKMTQVIRDEEMIHRAFYGMGWKLYATNQPQADLPLDEAVRLYRAAPRMERHFHLFKDTPIGIEPMYVKNDDQIQGLCRLLSLCERLMTLIEVVTRRYLSQHRTTLDGLYEGNPNRKTDTPTAVRLLRAFRGISRVRFVVKNKDSPYTTPLNSRQQHILSMLSISESIYQTPHSDSDPLTNFGRRCGAFLAQLCHTVNGVLNRP